MIISRKSHDFLGENNKMDAKKENVEAEVFRKHYATLTQAVKGNLDDLIATFYSEKLISPEIRDKHNEQDLLKAIEARISTGEGTTFDTAIEILKANDGTRHVAEAMEKELDEHSSQKVSRPTNIRSQPVNAVPSPQTNICKAKPPIQQMSSPAPTDEFRRLEVTEKGATKYAKTVQAFSEQTTHGQRSEIMVTSEVNVPVTVRSHFTYSEVDDLRQQFKELKQETAEHKLETAQKFEEQKQQIEEHNQQFEQLHKLLAEKDSRLQDLESKYQNVVEEKSQLEEQLSKVLDELEIEKGRNRESQGRIKELEVREKRLEEEIKTVKKERCHLQEQFNDAEIKQKLQKYSSETHVQ